MILALLKSRLLWKCCHKSPKKSSELENGWLFQRIWSLQIAGLVVGFVSDCVWWSWLDFSSVLASSAHWCGGRWRSGGGNSDFSKVGFTQVHPCMHGYLCLSMNYSQSSHLHRSLYSSSLCEPLSLLLSLSLPFDFNFPGKHITNLPPRASSDREWVLGLPVSNIAGFIMPVKWVLKAYRPLLCQDMS